MVSDHGLYPFFDETDLEYENPISRADPLSEFFRDLIDTATNDTSSHPIDVGVPSKPLVLFLEYVYTELHPPAFRTEHDIPTALMALSLAEKWLAESVRNRIMMTLETSVGLAPEKIVEWAVSVGKSEVATKALRKMAWPVARYYGDHVEGAIKWWEGAKLPVSGVLAKWNLGRALSRQDPQGRYKYELFAALQAYCITLHHDSYRLAEWYFGKPEAERMFDSKVGDDPEVSRVVNSVAPRRA